MYKQETEFEQTRDTRIWRWSSQFSWRGSYMTSHFIYSIFIVCYKLLFPIYTLLFCYFREAISLRFLQLVCKSKSGRTRHKRSKHPDENCESSAAVPPNSTITSDKVCGLICDIGQYLTDENIYKEDHVEAVKKLKPSESFIKFLAGVLLKFKRQKNHNNFMAKRMLVGKSIFHQKTGRLCSWC